jgi:DNA polymerase III epsilon subunit-like protein
MKSIRSYVVFDFETSGLDHRSDRIIQVGLCTVSDGEVRDRQSWLVRQEVRIDPEATRVHGIRVEDLRACGVPPQESLTRLSEAMRTAPVCMGHNIHRFDVPFLRAECRRHGTQPPATHDFVDTAALFKGWKLGMPKRPHESHQDYAHRVLSIRAPGLKYSVEACARTLGIQADTTGLHNADQDAYFTHLIFEALQKTP